MARNRKMSGTADGRLSVRLKRPTDVVTPGLHPLGLDANREAFLYVPATYRPERPAPFVLSLHGAGGPRRPGCFHSGTSPMSSD